jgi:hypothetical protein
MESTSTSSSGYGLKNVCRPRYDPFNLTTHDRRMPTSGQTVIGSMKGSSSLTNSLLIIWPLHRTGSNSTHLLTTTLGFIMINKKGGLLGRLELYPANGALTVCSYLRLFLDFLTAYPAFRH